ncbi:hypothetical protein BGY98DRAFT_935936 [Russula aff. rugulosa BPL654]|nr:hypothetical protein BGY98DRAFT_935936 [Russula aff. rugulosa BPL654]
MSNNKYDTHVSAGPTILELGDKSWPDGGETDIVEDVNDQDPNGSTLHTSPRCTMRLDRVDSETGYPTGLDYNAYTDMDPNTGSNPNTDFGVQYAMECTPQFIKVWFWTRHADDVPLGLRSNISGWVNTDSWGTVTAIQVDNWQAMNTTFQGCPDTCEDYVDINPAAFSNACFKFK